MVQKAESLNPDREEITLLPFVFCASQAQGKEIDIHEVLPMVCVDNSNGISRGGRNRDFKVFRMMQRIFDPKTKKMASGTKFCNLNSPPNITYLLTPWSRVILEKLTVNFAASQEIPRIYVTRNFLTVPTSARHLSLS
jgi:hypothetical protein